MCENTVDTQQDLLRYKQMYLRIWSALLRRMPKTAQ